MESPPAWNSWLTAELKARSIDTDVFVDYITGVVSDSTLDAQDRRETLEGILASATEDDAEALAGSLLAKWEEICRTAADEAESGGGGPVAAEAGAAASMKALMAEEDAALAKARKRREELSQLTELSEAQKQRLIAEYGTEENVMLDEQGNLINGEALGGDGDGEDCAEDGDSGLAPNLNRARVEDIEKRKRMEAKAASEAKKKKDKEDLARQKLRKVEDKERRRTTKKEKRRG